MEIILKFWNIVNIKTLFKGKYKRLDDASPISDLNDNRIAWMAEFVTFKALSHTMDAMVYTVWFWTTIH